MYMRDFVRLTYEKQSKCITVVKVLYCLWAQFITAMLLDFSNYEIFLCFDADFIELGDVSKSSVRLCRDHVCALTCRIS